MEIRIECNCGTRYKFDVEPIHNRMPAPVVCPACGADGTEQANAFLSRGAEPEFVTAAAAPPPPVPVAAAPVRIVGSPPPPRPAPLPARSAALSQAPAEKTHPIVGVLSILLLLAVVGFGLWKTSSRWYRRIDTVVSVAQALKSGGSDDTADAPQNLTQEDSVVLFIRHTNHLEISQACIQFWKEKLNKTLAAREGGEEEMEENTYCLIPAHNGFVQLIGGLNWPQPHYEGLAQHLSQRFGTLVFETRDVDFSGEYHFGVYETGVRKFHAQMTVRIANGDAEETVTTEGNDWALAHGFKPGPEGFKEFHLGDADAITQKMGMKMWDEKETDSARVLLLKEQGT